MIYDKMILNTIIGRGLLLPMGVDETSTQETPTGNTSITVYSGLQANSDDLINNWPTYNTTYLLHFSDVLYYHQYTDLKANSTFLTLNTAPAAQTAQGTGDADWAIIWIGNQSESNVNGSTIPNTSFLIASVSNTAGNGTIKLDNTSVVSGNTYNITDSIISVTFN